MKLPIRMLCRASVVAILAAPVAAQEQAMTAEEFLDSLDYHSGEIDLPGGVARLDLPDTFLYLDPDDTKRVLVDAWGNPPGAGADNLGMLVPADVSLLDERSWAVVISYEEEGYVDDDDASGIDYDELLASMQESTRASNEARREAGYPAVELVGWAAPPRYDATEHKLYWAKSLRFEDAPEETLNYNVRILGRKGVLVLNVIAGMPDLAAVEESIPTVLAMTNFTDGNQYSDFDPDLDKVAAYGIGALIAGKVAAKAGLFAKLGVLLLALKKLWIFLLIGAVALVRGLFKRKTTAEAA